MKRLFFGLIAFSFSNYPFIRIPDYPFPFPLPDLCADTHAGTLYADPAKILRDLST